MKKQPLAILLATTALCLIILTGARTISAEPFETVLNNGSPQNRVDIAVLGDGYTAAQLQQYRNDVQQFIQGVFGQEPYKEYQRYYNVHRIDVTSNQSGADHPERTPPVAVDTALDATYNCAGIQRLICVNTTKVNQIIAASLPANHYDVILVIVNDPEYGGSGGAVAVASINPGAFVELILHEVGHSFALLADEYAGGGPQCNPNVEPAEVNTTRETQRALIKWNVWINPATPIPTTTTTPALPGLYEGSRYCDTGLYRPTFNDKMRTIGQPFEQITSEQHVKRIHAFMSPIDASAPTGNAVTITTAQTQNFSVTPLVPFTHTLNVNWTVNNQAAGTGANFSLNGATLPVGQHNVQAIVTDPTVMVRNDPAQVLRATRTWTLNVQPAATRAPFDFDGDAKSDISVFRPNGGSWFVLGSQNGFSAAQFGIATDKIAPADFDGDGKTDYAVFRAGSWYLLRSQAGFTGVQFGVAGDLPRPADFDGDGKADICVFRPSNGAWYRLNSSDGQFVAVQFGANGDFAVPADFDGDGKADINVFRPAAGGWFRLNSSNGQFAAVQFGASGDLPAAGDFDGDNKVDISVFRPSTGSWYRLNSSNGAFAAVQFGASGDAPAVGDFDGDGKADISVFRPSTGSWYRLNSSNGQFAGTQFGSTGDAAIPAFQLQ